MQTEATKASPEEHATIDAVKKSLMHDVFCLGLGGVPHRCMVVAVTEVLGSLIASGSKSENLESNSNAVTDALRASARVSHSKLVKLGMSA